MSKSTNRTREINGNLLKAAIAERGLTLHKASLGMGYTAGTLQQICSRGRCSIPVLHAIERVYGIAYEQIAPAPPKPQLPDDKRAALADYISAVRMSMVQIDEVLTKLEGLC